MIATSIAIVLSSRPSVFVSNLKAICLKTLNPIILNENDGIFLFRKVQTAIYNKEEKSQHVAQIVAICLGTRCPPREQRLLVSCSPVPHHVVPEESLEGHGSLQNTLHHPSPTELTNRKKNPIILLLGMMGFLIIFPTFILPLPFFHQ